MFIRGSKTSCMNHGDVNRHPISPVILSPCNNIETYIFDAGLGLARRSGKRERENRTDVPLWEVNHISLLMK